LRQSSVTLLLSLNNSLAAFCSLLRRNDDAEMEINERQQQQPETFLLSSSSCENFLSLKLRNKEWKRSLPFLLAGSILFRNLQQFFPSSILAFPFVSLFLPHFHIIIITTMAFSSQEALGVRSGMNK